MVGGRVESDVIDPSDFTDSDAVKTNMYGTTGSKGSSNLLNKSSFGDLSQANSRKFDNPESSSEESEMSDYNDKDVKMSAQHEGFMKQKTQTKRPTSDISKKSIAVPDASSFDDTESNGNSTKRTPTKERIEKM